LGIGIKKRNTNNSFNKIKIMSVSLDDAPPVNDQEDDKYKFTRNDQGYLVNKYGKERDEQEFWDKNVAEAKKKKLADAQAGKNDSVPYYDGDERGWGEMSQDDIDTFLRRK